MQEYPRTQKILIFIQVLAWSAIIGFIIKASAILISYYVSCSNPEAAKNLYMGLNLYDLRQSDFWMYTRSVFFLVSLQVVRSAVFFLIIQTLSKISLKNSSPV